MNQNLLNVGLWLGHSSPPGQAETPLISPQPLQQPASCTERQMGAGEMISLSWFHMALVRAPIPKVKVSGVGVFGK